MPPSQLRRLKSSLREQGITDSQKSKKKKRQANKNGFAKEEGWKRNTALQRLREQFNPFEIRAPARNKYEYANGRASGEHAAKVVLSRPGVTKGLGEEKRRKTLLVEIQRRKKVGGIVDRRFGENDPTMTPEERALERFVKEKQRGNRKGALFDLEDDEEIDQLTHFGEALSFGQTGRVDDFRETDIQLSDRDSLDISENGRPTKRRRISQNSLEDDNIHDINEQKQMSQFKTRKEIMSEVIKKSKLHKYERQQAKEDDDNLLAELDRGLPEVFALLQGAPKIPIPAHKSEDAHPTINPARAALLNGKDRSQADKEYDERLRQMAFDQRSKPTEKTLTEEEKVHRGAEKLKELEEKRLRRMNGEESDSDKESATGMEYKYGEEDIDHDEDNKFRLGSGIVAKGMLQELGVEDEDEFVLDDDLIVNSSEESLGESGSSKNSDTESSLDSDENEFVQGLISKSGAGKRESFPNQDQDGGPLLAPESQIAYTYKCPQNHNDLLQITKNVPAEELPIVVQRIRALYHPKLDSGNKAKLAVFSTILVDHIFFMGNQAQPPNFTVFESIIRHIHSLAKTFSEDISRSFRSHMKSIHEERPTAPTPGDLILLTAIGSIFTTSDHFHQVVTPAVLCMTRYLSQRVPQTLGDLVTGTYIESLCLHYQRVSKRYIPEVVNYSLQVLLTLAPMKAIPLGLSFPYHPPNLPLHIRGRSGSSEPVNRQLRFWDVLSNQELSNESNEHIKVTLVETQIALINIMVNLWAEKSAFCEVFGSVAKVLRHLLSKSCTDKFTPTTHTFINQTFQSVQAHLQSSHTARRPLALHNHRPLAIKTAIPQFEESFNPDQHYDRDRDRAERNKLQAEVKRERKGAIRELRKDASFIARETLREKKERDSAYERKYKRLVAEIQGEEGRESKAYEREKRLRKGKR